MYSCFKVVDDIYRSGMDRFEVKSDKLSQRVEYLVVVSLGYTNFSNDTFALQKVHSFYFNKHMFNAILFGYVRFHLKVKEDKMIKLAVILVTLIILNVIVILMGKSLSRIELFTSSLFAIVLQLTVDVILEFKYGLYHYFEKGVSYETFLIVFGIYPQICMIFLNYFPFQKSRLKQMYYIIGWSVFALFYEWICLKTGVFIHTGWKLLYSVPLYPILFLILLGNLILAKRLTKI